MTKRTRLIINIIIIVSAFGVLLYYYNRKPIFTYFGVGPFWFFSIENPIGIDKYGNYMHVDEGHNIVFVIITNVSESDNDRILNRFPFFVSNWRCKVFGGTKHETVVDLNDNYFIIVNAKTKNEFRVPLEKDFIKNNMAAFYRKIYFDDHLRESNLVDEVVKWFPDIARNVEALKVP